MPRKRNKPQSHLWVHSFDDINGNLYDFTRIPKRRRWSSKGKGYTKKVINTTPKKDTNQPTTSGETQESSDKGKASTTSKGTCQAIADVSPLLSKEPFEPAHKEVMKRKMCVCV